MGERQGTDEAWSARSGRDSGRHAHATKEGRVGETKRLTKTTVRVGGRELRYVHSHPPAVRLPVARGEQKGMRRRRRRRQLRRQRRSGALMPTERTGPQVPGRVAYLAGAMDISECPPDTAQLVVTGRSCGIEGPLPAAGCWPPTWQKGCTDHVGRPSLGLVEGRNLNGDR